MRRSRRQLGSTVAVRLACAIETGGSRGDEPVHPTGSWSNHPGKPVARRSSAGIMAATDLQDLVGELDIEALASLGTSVPRIDDAGLSVAQSNLDGDASLVDALDVAALDSLIAPLPREGMGSRRENCARMREIKAKKS